MVEILIVTVILALLAAIYLATFTAVRDKSRANVCLSNMRQIGLAVLQYAQDHDETMPLGASTGDPSGAPNEYWYQDVSPYVTNRKPTAAAAGAAVFYVCPSKPDFIDRDGGYGINSNLVGAAINGSFTGSSKNLPQIATPNGTFLVCDAAQLDPARIGQVSNNPVKWGDIEVQPTEYQVTPPSSWDGTHTYYTDPPSDANLRRPSPRHQNGLNVVYCDGHIKWIAIGQFVGPLPGGWPYGDPRNSWDDK